MLGVQHHATTATATATATAATAAPNAKPKPNVAPMTRDQMKPPADRQPVAETPGKLMSPESFDAALVGKKPVTRGDGLHSLTYNGQAFQAQITTTVSRALSWYNSATKKFEVPNYKRGETWPVGQKSGSINFDIREARLAHLEGASEQALAHKRLYDFVKTAEQANFELSVPAYVAKASAPARSPEGEVSPRVGRQEEPARSGALLAALLRVGDHWRRSRRGALLPGAERRVVFEAALVCLRRLH